MRAAEKYDLVVLGDQIGGYFLATAAAQAGKKVLLVESSNTASAVYERLSGNFLLDLSWEPLIGLVGESEIDHFCKNLGLYQNVDELFPACDPALQIIDSEARIEHEYNPEVLSAEYNREYQLRGKKERRLFYQLASKKNRASRLRDLIVKTGLGVEWEKLGQIQAALYGNCLPRDMYLDSYHSLMSRSAKGVRFIKGGKSSLKELLIGRLQVFGGKIKRNAIVEEIVIEKNKLAGVMLSSFEGFVRAQRVVSALSLSETLALLPKAYRPRNLQQQVADAKPKYWRYSFSIRLPEYVIPEGMGNHICVQKRESGFAEDLFMQIFRAPKATYGGIAPSETVLLVRTLIPYSEQAIKPEYISRTMKRSLKYLETVIPFLGETELSISPAPADLAGDEIFKKFFHFPSLKDVPLNLLVYESDLVDERNALQLLDWSRYHLPGLYVCAREIYPLYGLHGEIVAAMQLSKLVSRQ